MRGESGVCFTAEYCGSRNCGWFGSFQIDHRVTFAPKWRAAAVTNAWNSFGFGRVRLSFAPFVAHRGTGPETVSSTFHPRAIAPSTCGSYALQSYFVGSVASKSGLTRDVAAGATFCHSITMRVDLTPKLEISSNADVRVVGFARSTGASKVMVCEREACAPAGRMAATSAQVARMAGAILLMSGG